MGKDPAEVKQEIEQTRADLGEDVDTLREQVNQQGGVKGVAGKAASKAGHAARSEAEAAAKKKLESESEKAKERLESAPQMVKKELKSAPQKVKATKKKAQQHPFAGIVVALGTGWLLRSLRKAARRSSRSRT